MLPPKDNSEPKVIGHFVLGVRVYQNPDGTSFWKTDFQLQNMPTEVAIMQTKAFLRRMEQKYYDNFDNSLTEVQGDPRDPK